MFDALREQHDPDIVPFQGLQNPAQPLILGDVYPLGVHEDGPHQVGPMANQAVLIERQQPVGQPLLPEQPSDFCRHVRFIGQIYDVSETLRDFHVVCRLRFPHISRL